MHIKFKKLFKTAIIFFTVFVMVFNSFAAISVSDGSAFVTKAEFSADLNNLSNRMSALENSIDAKIDSLVSSYLSRNGIWNGEKQTVSKNTAQNSLNYFYATIGYGASSTTLNTISAASGLTYYQSVASFYSNRDPIEAKNLYKPVVAGIGTYTIVSQISKSGLICVNYQYYCGTGTPYIDGSYRTSNYPLGRSGWANSRFSYGWATPLRWEFIETNQSNTKVGDSLFSVSQPFSNTSIVPDLDTGAKITYTDVTTSFYAFVSKGNKLRIIGSIVNSSSVTDGFGGGYVGLTSYYNTLGDCPGIFSSITIRNIYVY